MKLGGLYTPIMSERLQPFLGAINATARSLAPDRPEIAARLGKIVLGVVNAVEQAGHACDVPEAVASVLDNVNLQMIESVSRH